MMFLLTNIIFIYWLQEVLYNLEIIRNATSMPKLYNQAPACNFRSVGAGAEH